MTFGGKFLVENSNDPAFITGHTYSVTGTVSQKIDLFGITDVTPVETVDEEITESDTTDETGETDGTVTPTVNPNSTPPATA